MWIFLINCILDVVAREKKGSKKELWYQFPRIGDVNKKYFSENCTAIVKDVTYGKTNMVAHWKPSWICLEKRNIWVHSSKLTQEISA